MARPRKKGLEYFPMDADFFNDIKIRKLIHRQGGKAISVYVSLLCNIYKEGYYIVWDNDLRFVVSEQTGLEEAYIQEVLKSCLSVGLFHADFFNEGKVLTSEGIQKRYSEVLSWRKENIDKYSLMDNFPEKTDSFSKKTTNNEEFFSKNEQETGFFSEKPPVFSKKPPVFSKKPPQNKNKRKRKENNNVVVARARENEEFFKSFFETHPVQIETLCMQLGVKKDELRKAAKEVLAEWDITEISHEDYSDMAKHMINQLRIKLNDKRKQKNADNNGRNNNQQGNETSHRGETDAEFQARIYRQVLNSQPKQDECDGTEPF